MAKEETADLICRLALLKRRTRELFALDYSHRDYRRALRECETYIDKNIQDLSRAAKSRRPETIRSKCSDAATNSNFLIRCLGILANAGVGENLYECHAPLRTLFQRALNKDADVNLILTKDWQFNALIYPEGPRPLKDFTIVGLPASEGSNPLLVALAGHEIGHAIFRQQNTVQRAIHGLTDLHIDEFLNKEGSLERLGIVEKLDDKDMLLVRSSVKKICLSQLEEIFCDAVGVYLFGRAFLFSYHYVLKSSKWPRHTRYPDSNARAKSLMFFAEKFRIDKPSIDLELHSIQDTDDQRIRAIDEIVLKCIDQVPPVVEEYFKNIGITPPSVNAIAKAQEQMEDLVPVDGDYSMVDIINAGWECFETKKSDPSRLAEEYMDQIFEIVFKSLEFLEIREKLEA